MTEPWWAPQVFAGVFLIVGGVLGFISSLVLDTRRAHREDTRRLEDAKIADRRRFDNDVREIYLRVVGLATPFCTQESLTWQGEDDRAAKMEVLTAAAEGLNLDTPILSGLVRSPFLKVLRLG